MFRPEELKKRCSMYLHLGEKKVVKKRDIIGIFDMDTSTLMKSTRNFLNSAEKSGRAETLSYELPKSFTVCRKKGESKNKVYISQITPATLLKRSEDKF